MENRRVSVFSSTTALPSDLREATKARRVTCSTISNSSLSYMTSDKLASQWEELMRKFSHDCKRDYECKTTLVDNIPCEQKPLRCFNTGSKYEGTWDALGMCGYGVYTFPNGVVYEGEFMDNMFHGEGEMTYPDGTCLVGTWDAGELVTSTIRFSDGVHYKENDWEYCTPLDRRFSIEYQNGLSPKGEPYMTAEQPPREIPPGMYDSGSGFYNPQTKCIHHYEDLTRVERYPSKEYEKWIVKNCRKNPDAPIGPARKLYQPWTKAEVEVSPPPSPGCLSTKSSICIQDSPASESTTSPTVGNLRRLSDACSAQGSSSQNPIMKHATFRYDPKIHDVDTSSYLRTSTSQASRKTSTVPRPESEVKNESSSGSSFGSGGPFMF